MSSPQPRPRPVLVYDGDCAFCTRSVEFAVGHLPADVDFVPWQHADLDALGITRERAEHEIVWVPDFIDPAGVPDDASGGGAASPFPSFGVRGRLRAGRRGGAQAAAAYIVYRGGPLALLGRLARIPPFRWVAAVVYRLIALNRHRLPGGTPACALPAADRPGQRQPGRPRSDQTTT